jgi:hypothetical protein
MQQGRASTIRFNEWICVCAQYEKAVARIGRQVYQGYSRGLISDNHALELCKEISQCFADSKKIRADLEEELERDALHGLSAEEARAAEDALEMSSTQRAMRRAKLKLAKLMGRNAVNRNLQSYRNRVVELSRDLGLRALAMHTKDPLLKMEAHLRLCQLAVNLDQESNKKWEEITQAKNAKGGMDLSFHTMLISFVSNFANFSRNTALGKMLLKLLKYDSVEEEKKLTKQFEGSKTADALVAQIAEVDEPDPDIGREMATMEKDYVETPSDWGLPPVADTWIPDTSENWSPTPVKESPKSPPAPASVPKPEPAKPASSPDGPKPQVLRRRQPEPFAATDVWAPPEDKEAPAASPAPVSEPPPAAPVRIGQNPMAAASVEEDWSTESPEDDEPVPQAPRLGSPPSLSPASPPASPPRPLPTAGDVAGGPAKPPAMPPKPSALGATRPQPPLPLQPPEPTRPLELRSESAASKPQSEEDPLLRLLRTEEKSDDDLLPAFLRDRMDHESFDSTAFIPDLPDSVDSGLKIIPFGSQPSKDNDTFIPKMPD